jgi:hypothetical protein
VTAPATQARKLPVKPLYPRNDLSDGLDDGPVAYPAALTAKDRLA